MSSKSRNSETQTRGAQVKVKQVPTETDLIDFIAQKWLNDGTTPTMLGRTESSDSEKSLVVKEVADVAAGPSKMELDAGTQTAEADKVSDPAEAEKQKVSQEDPAEAPLAMPLLSKGRFHVKPNTSVKIKLKDSPYLFIGRCLVDPSTTTSPDTIVLHKVYGKDLGTVPKASYYFDRKSFAISDIAEMVVEESESKIPSERNMASKELHNMGQVLGLLDLIEEAEMKEIVLHGLIEGDGRFGEMGWLIIVVKGMMMCIDTMALAGDKRFWKVINDRIFKRQDLVKVTFNCSKMMDYLYHTRGIKGHNVWDCQVAEMYIRANMHRDQMPLTVEERNQKSVFNWEYKSILFCYENMVKAKLHPAEIDYLKEHESAAKNVEKGLYTERPTPFENPVFKVAALTVKYLMDLYNVQMDIVLTHARFCMREQIATVVNGGHADTLEQPYIPHSVKDRIMKGQPYLKGVEKLTKDKDAKKEKHSSERGVGI